MYEIGAGLLRWTGPSIGAPARTGFGRDGQGGGTPYADPEETGAAADGADPASCDRSDRGRRPFGDTLEIGMDVRAILASGASEWSLRHAFAVA